MFVLGVLMTVAFAAGDLAERFELPRVAAYVAVGALFSVELLGRFVNLDPGEWSSELTNIALSIIAFIVGAELNLKWLRTKGKTIAVGVLGQSLGTVAVICGGIYLYSWLMLPSDAPIAAIALILGVIGSATAPAATVAVIERYRSSGPLTSTILSIVAIDDALSIIYFTIAGGILAASVNVGDLALAFWEIAGAILVGGALGVALGLYGKRAEDDTCRLAVMLGSIFLTIGLSRILQFSNLLSCMSLGLFSRRLSPFAAEKWLHPIETIRESVFLVFFVLAGLQFKFHVLIGSFGFIAVYIVLRTVGKYGGALLGTKSGGAPPKVYRHAGLALLPQAGVAIGLALQATESQFLAGQASLVLNTVLGSTIIFALVSPVLTERALKEAGEIGKRNTEENEG